MHTELWHNCLGDAADCRRVIAQSVSASLSRFVHCTSTLSMSRIALWEGMSREVRLELLSHRTGEEFSSSCFSVRRN